ncbi:MAG: HAD family phosphatase [Cyanobacteriota bacterium]|nr:HAD family phosphatase [Cyanobacteriota bacterium]
MTLKAVLFDFNGIIINDESIHAELVSDILLGENLRVSPEDYQEVCLGRSDRACFKELLAARGRFADDTALAQLIDRKAQAYRQRLETLEELPLYPVESFLSALEQSGVAIALVTGALRVEVEAILTRASLANYFSCIVAGDEIASSKPDPYGYLLAVERLGRAFPALNLAPKNCLAIEDTFAGIEAAKNAGMQVVGVANTYPFHMLQRCCNWTVDCLADLELERVRAVFSGSASAT